MIEQVSNAIVFFAFFTYSKLGVTGLTVTVDVYNPAGTLVVTAGSATAVGGGLYKYSLSSGSTATEGEYVAIFKTTETNVDFRHVPSLWSVGRAGNENLNATITSRIALTDNLSFSGATDKTVRDALKSGWVVGTGKWVISGNSLVLYEPDNTTIYKTFTLNDAINPTTRT